MSKHKVCQYQVAEGGNWWLSRWGGQQRASDIEQSDDCKGTHACNVMNFYVD